MVLNEKLFGYGSNSMTNKMSTLITSKTSWTSKPSDNIVKYKPRYCISGTILDKFCFILPSQVIYCGNYISGL